MSAGSFIGALCAGFIADKWGRRYALMGAAVVWIIGAAIQCSSQNVGHLIAGRIISGLSVGVTSSQVCVYLAELAPGRIRGRIVGIQQWAIEWGILIMFLIAYGCTSVAGPAAFRIAWGVQAIPGFILFGALIFFPESPRWLAGQERWEECLGVLAAIHAKGNRDDPVVQAEYLEVQEAVRVMQEAKGVGFLELFGPKVWKVSGRFALSLDIHHLSFSDMQHPLDIFGHGSDSIFAEDHVRHISSDVATTSRRQCYDVLRRLRVQYGGFGELIFKSGLIFSTLSMPVHEATGDADLFETDWKHQPLLLRDPICHLPGDNGLRLAFHRQDRAPNAAFDRCCV